MGEIKANTAYLGLNTDAIPSQVKPGQVTYAQNAQIFGFEGNSITYQNEQANTLCCELPTGYIIIGTHNIVERDIIILFLVNPTTGDSEIGKIDHCVYSRIINSKCLNFSLDRPIHKIVHKITSCSIEVYWADYLMRYIDLSNLPFKEVLQGIGGDPCAVVTTSEIDCNKLRVQPDFYIPQIDYKVVRSDGTIPAGIVQFAIQYSNALGDPYTSYYSVTNPISIYDFFKVTPDFNYEVNKSVVLNITNLDTTGVYDFFNLAVIKTVNNISSVDLVGTFEVRAAQQTITYTGQSKANITLSIDDIFEKFPIYDTAGDITTVQDVLVWANMTTAERMSYQNIANQIIPYWVSYQLPPSKDQYKDEINTAEFRGYMGDEVYPFDVVFLTRRGGQSDRFPILGRRPRSFDLELITNKDAQFEENLCTQPEAKPRWQVYNTANILGVDPNYNANDDCYQGPYQYGEFGYWESTETYPCNRDVWGDLSGTPIRHHKFPDRALVPHHDAKGNVFPLGIRLDLGALTSAIRNSTLTQEQKDEIVAVKIVRGNAANSKSIEAKGLIFNVGKYAKEDTEYFYPNYPFNDLRADPFISNSNSRSVGEEINSSFSEVRSVGTSITPLYSTIIPAGTWKNDGDVVTAIYNGRFNGFPGAWKVLMIDVNGQPVYNSGGLQLDNTSSFILTSVMTRIDGTGYVTVKSKLEIIGNNATTVDFDAYLLGINFLQDYTVNFNGRVVEGFPPPNDAKDGDITATSYEIGYKPAPIIGADPNLLDGFSSSDSRKRYTFHSPDTSFYQPSLGALLKLETVEYGTSRSHFVQVKNHAKYSFPSIQSYLTSLTVGLAIGFASGTYGVSVNVFNGQAAFTAFSIVNDIIFRLLPKKNMAYQFNSLGNYTQTAPVQNDTGNKIRQIEIGTYLISAMQGVGDTLVVNNYQRESSVYLRLNDDLPYPHSIPGIPFDTSRFTLGEVGCREDFYTRDISAYYAAIKNISPDQYGQIYSYDAIDTGYQFLINLEREFPSVVNLDIFGGDTFINKFAFKRKLPFFLDNRVNFPDNADVFYDELGNIGYPKYWFSTDIRRGSGGSFNLGALFGVKVNNFDCENSAFFYDAGKIYLFAYGIVNFFVESRVNVDHRQAYNTLEGDYYPHVSGDVPDDWLQETNVPIAYDNTYTYNKTYSKQNIENTFTTLPTDFVPGSLCRQQLPNRAIYSEFQQDVINYTKNNWRIYRPVAKYDFPLNFGNLVSLDGIESRVLLARFENKSQLYNSLLTAEASIGDVYLGQSIFNRNIPPIDFAETDLGFTGSQHKFLLKTEFGHLWVDAKRGDVFLLQGQSINDISNEGVKHFLTKNLDFKIQNAFSTYPIDNNFKGVGLHGVYDMRYNRVIITKLDFLPLRNDIVYDTQTDTFRLDNIPIELADSRYFCDVSFTLSYSLVTKSWTSFHSYLPNAYIGGLNVFYTGVNENNIWVHNTQERIYNTFYGEIEPYIVEYPITYKYQDEILQSVKDYTKINKMYNTQTFVQTDDIFFNKAIIYNDQQCSGVLNLVHKAKNNLSLYLQYPKYNSDSKDILYVKSDNFYNYNGFWDIVKDYSQPIWAPDCSPESENKILNIANMDYANRSFKKYPIRSKDCKIRHILDNRNDIRLTSQFIASESQISYK